MVKVPSNTIKKKKKGWKSDRSASQTESVNCKNAFRLYTLTLENKANIGCAMSTYSLFRFNWETDIQEGVKLVENKATNWNVSRQSIAQLETNNPTDQLIRVR